MLRTDARLKPASPPPAGNRFSTARQPYMARRNYHHEIRSAFTFPIAAALAEGTFASVIAAKYFGAGVLLLAVISAAPMFGNILALFWAELAERRPKVRFVNLLQLGVVATVAAVGLTYFLPTLGGEPVWWGGWVFAGLIVVARVLASGIVTLRSTIWRYNYPRQSRAQIVSRITVVYNLILGSMTFAGAMLLDAFPASYALMYPLLAAVSLIGVHNYSKIRVRGEGARLRQQRLGDGDATADGPRLDYERPSALASFGTRLRTSFAVLGEDETFRKYQWLQFALGASFMLMFPSLIHMVSKEMTDPATQYALAVLVLHLIPMLTGVVAIQLWAPVFDRMPLLKFRSVHSTLVVVTHATTLTAALTDQLWLVGVATFLIGTCMGGGQLAWQLGQHAFAPAERSGAYMGVHVMLTGLRGMLAPFLGVGVYHLLGQTLTVNGVSGGRFVFAGSVLLAALGLVGYVRMSRRVGRLPYEN